MITVPLHLKPPPLIFTPFLFFQQQNSLSLQRIWLLIEAWKWLTSNAVQLPAVMMLLWPDGGLCMRLMCSLTKSMSGGCPSRDWLYCWAIYAYNRNVSWAGLVWIALSFQLLKELGSLSRFIQAWGGVKSQTCHSFKIANRSHWYCWNICSSRARSTEPGWVLRMFKAGI